MQEARQLCQVGGGLGLKKLKGLRIESSAWVLTAECSNPKDLETKTKLGDLIERTNPLM